MEKPKKFKKFNNVHAMKVSLIRSTALHYVGEHTSISLLLNGKSQKIEKKIRFILN